MASIKNFSQTFALICVSILVAIIIGEIGLRLLGFSYPSFYGPDRYTGFSLRPNVSGLWSNEGHASIQTNRYGYRDRDHELNKPANTFRIAVLGDSYSEALQVDIDDTYWSILESKLNKHIPDKKVEVLNFGVSGYGTALEYLTLQHRVWKFKPDLILLQFLAVNDIKNNSRVLQHDSRRPYFVFDDEGNLQLDDGFLTSGYYTSRNTIWAKAIYKTIGYSRVLQLLNKYKSQRMLSKVSARRVQLGLDYEVFKVPTDKDWKNAWSVTDALLLEIQKSSDSYNVPFLVINVGTGFQVHPDPGYRNKIINETVAEDLDYPGLRLQQLSKQSGFKFLDLVPIFSSYALKNNVYLHGFKNATLGEGHWNKEGHKLAGNVIADYILNHPSILKR